jgi:hypothetical protein
LGDANVDTALDVAIAVTPVNGYAVAGANP